MTSTGIGLALDRHKIGIDVNRICTGLTLDWDGLALNWHGLDLDCYQICISIGIGLALGLHWNGIRLA